MRWLCMSRLAHAVQIAISSPCIVSGGVPRYFYHVHRPKARQALLRMYAQRDSSAYTCKPTVWRQSTSCIIISKSPSRGNGFLESESCSPGGEARQNATAHECAVGQKHQQLAVRRGGVDKSASSRSSPVRSGRARGAPSGGRPGHCPGSGGGGDLVGELIDGGGKQRKRVEEHSSQLERHMACAPPDTVSR